MALHFCWRGAGRWVALVLAGSLVIRQADATTCFVAPGGSNSNAGTNVGAPFLTIQRAANQMAGGDLCLIRGGVYHEALAPSESGTRNAPITFAAYSNEVATRDGADAVTGWTFLSNGIYHAVHVGQPMDGDVDCLHHNQVLLPADSVR